MYAVESVGFLRKVLILGPPPRPEKGAWDGSDRLCKMAAVLQRVGFAAEREYVKTGVELRAALEKRNPDIVFSALDHLPLDQKSIRDGGRLENVHALFEDEGIEYIGSRPEVIDLALSKSKLKTAWLNKGIATPPYAYIPPGAAPGALGALKLPEFPLIVKPEAEGNSRGILETSVVFDRAALRRAVDALASEFDGGILVERYLGAAGDFQEITCAYIGNGAAARVMPARIVFTRPTRLPVVTTGDKDEERTAAIPIEDPIFLERVRDFAGAAFLAAGVRDYSRCDVVYAEGKFWALEVNGQPMVPDPWFASCCAHFGLSEEQYLTAIVAAGIARVNASGKKNLGLPDKALKVLDGLGFLER